MAKKFLEVKEFRQMNPSGCLSEVGGVNFMPKNYCTDNQIIK